MEWNSNHSTMSFLIALQWRIACMWLAGQCERLSKASNLQGHSKRTCSHWKKLRSILAVRGRISSSATLSSWFGRKSDHFEMWIGQHSTRMVSEIKKYFCCRWYTYTIDLISICLITVNLHQPQPIQLTKKKKTTTATILNHKITRMNLPTHAIINHHHPVLLLLRHRLRLHPSHHHHHHQILPTEVRLTILQINFDLHKELVWSDKLHLD